MGGRGAASSSKKLLVLKQQKTDRLCDGTSTAMAERTTIGADLVETQNLLL